MSTLPDSYRPIEDQLFAPTRDARLEAARQLAAGLSTGRIAPVGKSVEVNNHVHTIYSFSPHSPASAAWYALRAGLGTVGIMDHDSVGGCEEMWAAGALFNMPTTAGFELRVNLDGTPMAGRVLNGPGLTGIAYISIHGIPATALPRCLAFLRPLQAARNRRNIAMVDKLNAILRAQGLLEIDYQRDVCAASMAADDGAITERHILAALCRTVLTAHVPGLPLVDFLERSMRISLPSKIRGYLLDAQNPHYLYDLLGVLKAYYADEFFIHPDREECLPVRDVLAFSESIGAISAYAYLGDVSESPTGDKRAEQFEDEFLDDLMIVLRELGFRAVTYMPPRNTPAQLDRIGRLCREGGFMQISGVDINSSRQTFNCPELQDPRFANLVEAAWALIGHEKLSALVPGCGLFGARTLAHYPDLSERLRLFAEIGRAFDHYVPTAMTPEVKALAGDLLTVSP